ncbi:ABC transporter, ATP-binding protein domain containing protein, putative [Babesia bigemina]|uniref:ABC transporter, ATP-binding protein domain containing protein, putative n=1 Tax=Babesia bigemina TaxID=5866 RepID=A0A061D9H5_BABBI|nr:ABC transporter, ATP-binding protein domain containing protein, putative [Babesia bigemina]CDR95579.1 ABC transporter, ATP-binding protein domain containing protein, putative [Babesia bigemina]|eukprot:XP_012767765.1 ABC transporter, ATP-binding protein domain containing protein, putative [Babesia bigemina]
MEQNNIAGAKPRWYEYLYFWRPYSVMKRIQDGDYTADKGYGNYSDSRGMKFLSFGWITKWIGLVAYGNLHYDRYPGIPASDFDTFASTELSLCLIEGRSIPRGPFFTKVVGEMRWSILRVFRHAFTYLLFLTVMKDATELLVICLMKMVVGGVTLNSSSAILSYVLTTAAIASAIALDAFVEAYHHFYYRRMSLRVEITLQTLLFGKILARDRQLAMHQSVNVSFHGSSVDRDQQPSSDSSRATSEADASDEVNILNLALFDVDEISNGIVRVIDLVNVPIKVCMLSIWLYREIGWSSVQSLGIIGVMTVLMLLSECQCASLLKDYVRRVDLRLFKTQVVLEDLRNLRLVKWVGYAMENVMGSRMHELQSCLKRAYLSALSSWVGMVAPNVMALFIFVTSAMNNSTVLRGLNLDKSQALPLLHALSYFIRPLRKLPSDINDHMETSISCRRLEDYVYRKVLDTHVPTPYDKFSERVPDSNSDCQHPYKVDMSTLYANGRPSAFSIARRKFVNRLPAWMIPKMPAGSTASTSRSLTPFNVGIDSPSWSFIRSRDSITLDSELLRDSFMGVNYPHVVQFSHAFFGWTSVPILSNVNLTLRPNEVTFLIGPPGSGKTSLLSAILGDLQLLSGSVCVVPWEVNLPIGYVSQEPWIPVGTVRECILFGHQMDVMLYNRVVSAVGLDTDIANWEAGDLRVLDEGGQNLSTGQRVRISLARCLYNQMMHSHNVHAASYTLYCLDEPFSVLDPSLAVRIFTMLFGPTGLMTGASAIIVVQEGFIHTLRSSGVNFAGMKYFVYHLDGPITEPRLETLEEFEGKHVPNEPADAAGLQTADSFDELGVISALHTVEVFNTSGSIGDLDSTSDDPKSDVVTESSSKASSTQLGDNNQARGALRWSNFMWLFNHIGMSTVLTMLAVSFITVSMSIFSEQVVRCWGAIVDTQRCVLPEGTDDMAVDQIMMETQAYDPIMRLKLNHYYLFVLSNSLIVVLCMCIIFLEPLGTFQAARSVYESALGGVLRSPLSVFSTMRIGTINNRLSTDQTYVDYNCFTRFSSTASTLMYSTISIVMICILNWWSGAMLPIVLFLTFVVVVRDYLPMCRENMRTTLCTRAALCTLISQTVTGASVIRSSRREGVAMSQFLRYLDAYERTKFFHACAVAWGNVRIRIMGFPLILANVLSPLVQLMLQPPADCGTAMDVHVSTALMYSLKVSRSLKAVIAMMVDVSNIMCACQRLQDMSKLGPQYDHKYERLRISAKSRSARHGVTSSSASPERLSQEGAISFQLTRTGVVLRNVVVDYTFIPPVKSANETLAGADDAPQPVISYRRLSLSCPFLSFPPGQHVGIVGRTGSGKSTLLSALAGAVNLVRGTIELDGVNIERISSDENCTTIGNIPHNPPLLVHWTVRDYVDPKHEWEDVAIWEALYTCSAGPFVRSLPGPNPLDVVLKKSWTNKCKGKKDNVDSSGTPSVVILDVHLQYLSLARLWLYKRELRMLLVDEASVIGTSEGQSFQPIHELLNRLFRSCNVFLVAHNAESLQLCDRILVLDNGRVVGECQASEVSSQRDLAARCRQFARGANPPSDE